MKALNRDVFSGVLFIISGVLGVGLGSDLTRGTLARMGAGYFPIIVSCTLIALGFFISIASLKKAGDSSAKLHIRPIGMTILALLSFAAINEIGLILAVTSVVVLGALASPESRPREVVILVVALNAFCRLVFVQGLGMNVPVFPAGV